MCIGKTLDDELLKSLREYRDGPMVKKTACCTDMQPVRSTHPGKEWGAGSYMPQRPQLLG